VTTSVDWVRPPAVAGLFYPEDPDELRREVRGHLDAAAAPAAGLPGPAGPPAGDGPDAVIAPHAGYRFSGPTAGVAWAALAARTGAVARVVLVGPAHRTSVGGPGVGVSSARAWQTPLGDVVLDPGAAADLVGAGLAAVADEAHAPEHSLEVHLPFLIESLAPTVPVVPLLVGGRCPPEVAADAIGWAWDADGTVVVVSSDLSHYLPDDEARARDERTLAAITDGRVDDLGPEDACGRAAIAGLMVAARSRGVAPSVLAVATSADTAGDADRVVGYASVAYEVPPLLEAADRAWLVARARAAVVHEVTTGEPDPLADDDVPSRLRLLGASFVTLRRDGELTGCIGSLEAARPLWRDVVRNALAAAVDDPRFPPLEPEALPGLGVKVSVLSGTERLPSDREALAAAVRPGVDGVLVEAEGHRGTFLPSVWESLPEVDDFLTALLAKAGLATGSWPAGLRAWRYTTDEFGD